MKKIHPLLLFIILLPIGGLVDNFLAWGVIANPFLARGISRIAWIVIGVLVGMRIRALKIGQAVAIRPGEGGCR